MRFHVRFDESRLLVHLIPSMTENNAINFHSSKADIDLVQLLLTLAQFMGRFM